MRVAIIRGAPREFLTSLEIDPRWFDFNRRVPKADRIVLVAWIPAPVAIDPMAAEEIIEAGRVTLAWRRLALGPNDTRMWALEITDEPVKWGVLLNVAYTCRAHANMDRANRVREEFERALCPDDGHSRFIASRSPIGASPRSGPSHRLDTQNPPTTEGREER